MANRLLTQTEQDMDDEYEDEGSIYLTPEEREEAQRDMNHMRTRQLDALRKEQGTDVNPGMKDTPS